MDDATPIDEIPVVFHPEFDLPAEGPRVVRMVDVNLQSVETKLENTSDLGVRLLARLASNSALHTLQSEAVSLIRAEPSEPLGDRSNSLTQSYARIVERVAADIQAMSLPDVPARAVPIELLAYSLLGAYDNTQLRASWDDKYDRADLFRAHMWLYLAVRAALDGRVDIDSEVQRYEDLIQEAASGEGDAMR
jgi:hypothetical protein